nr:reverse transcriptase domain-containing protein [Tanacetum cinerariifolium]
MDDEPMWDADRVVALTLGFTITIPETANEFAIKGNHLTFVKGNQFDGRTKTDPHKHIHEFLRICAGGIFLYKTPNQAYQLLEDKVLLKLDWAKNQKTKPSLKKTLLSPMTVTVIPTLTKLGMAPVGNGYGFIKPVT